MNKATLVFVCNDPEAVAAVKKTFVEYFGTRMIEEVNPDYPVIRMRNTVDSYDMNQLSNNIPDNMTVLVITEDESIDITANNYLYASVG